MRVANGRVVMPKEVASPVPLLVRKVMALRAAKSHGTHRRTHPQTCVPRNVVGAEGGPAYFDVAGAGGAGLAPLLCSSTTRRAR